MKKFILLISIMACFSAALPQTNLLLNGDFETGNKNGWGGWNYGVTKKNPYQGSYSAETQTNYSGNAGINQTVSLEANKHYRASCYIQSKKENPETGFFIDQPISGGHKVPYLTMPIGNTEWTQYSIIFSPDNDSVDWRVGIYKHASGDLETDNWEVVEINPADYSSANDIISSNIGILDNVNKKITRIIEGKVTAGELMNGLSISNLAQAYIYSDTSYKYTSDDEIIGSDDFIRVFAENGEVQLYTLEFIASYLESTTHGEINQGNLTLTNVSDTITATQLLNHLTGSAGSTIKILDGPGGTALSDPDNTVVTNDMVVEVAIGAKKTEYKIETRAYSTQKDIVSSLVAVLDTENNTLTIEDGFLPAQLFSSIEVSVSATVKVVDQLGNIVALYQKITSDMKVRVTAENGSHKDYAIIVSGTLAVDVWYDKTDTIEALHGKVVHLTGKSTLYFLGNISDFKASVIDIQSDSSFVILPNIPVYDTTPELLAGIAISGEPLKVFDAVKVKDAEDASEAIPETNAMVRQYYSGSIINPYRHHTDQPAMIGYSWQNFEGSEKNYKVGYYKGNDAYVASTNGVRSIKLKRGFMATICTAIRTDKVPGDDNTFELGAIPYWYITNSRVYIASHADYEINLEEKLSGKANYIVITPWKWVEKKGVCTSNKLAAEMQASWKYNWWVADDLEAAPQYVPMIKSRGMVTNNNTWDRLMYVDNTPYFGTMTHLLGFNEPTAADQGDINVDDMITAWPRLLETGARLGSPAPKEGGSFLENLYNFMQKAEGKGYRVDYIAIHWYDWGNWISQQDPNADAQGIFNRFKSYIEDVYNTYKMPIWITEFNANKNRTPAVQKAFLELALPYLESTDYIERYAYFEPAGGNGPFFDADTNFTEVGMVYRNQISTPSQTGDTIYGHNNLPDGIVGIQTETFNKDRLVVYPNPVKSDVLNLKNAINGEIKVYNMLGAQQGVHIDGNIMYISNLPSGMYIIKHNNQITSFIKE